MGWFKKIPWSRIAWLALAGAVRAAGPALGIPSDWVDTVTVFAAGAATPSNIVTRLLRRKNGHDNDNSDAD